MIGIVVDTPDTNAALATRVGAEFSLLSDPKLETIRAYGVEHEGKDISRPATIVVGSDGTVLWSYVGDRPSDRPLLPDVLKVLDVAAAG